MDQSYKKEKILIIIDNSLIHTSGKTKEIYKRPKYNDFDVTSYSLQFAPIKFIYDYLKRNLCNHCCDLSVNLKKEDGKRVFKEWLGFLSK